MNHIKKCLIIDDDQDDQEIFLMCIQKIDENIDCHTVRDGITAISLLTSNVEYIPDYIFLDVNMPKMNGISCLKELRKIEKLEHTKILMYSTTSDHRVLNESRECGANGFIVKPMKTAELKEKLYTIFEIAPEINCATN